MNPVLQRELTERWRSRRAPITLTLYLAVLGGVLFLLYQVARSILGSPFGGMGMGGGMDSVATGPVLGRFLLEGLLFTVLMLVLFVAPAYAAAQVSGERERRTLPLLQVTLLRPWQIVAGKLGASTAWLVLLILAALPLGAGAFFLGGASLADLVRGVVYIVVVAVGIAGMALGVSSVARRTTGAVVLTYGLVLALVGGTTVVAAAEAIFEARSGSYDRSTPPLALYANPVFGLADAVRAGALRGMGGPSLPSPLGVVAEVLPQPPTDQFGQPQFDRGEAMMMVEPGFDGVVRDGPMMPQAVPVPDAAGQGPREPVWLKVMGVYLALGLLGLLVATRRLRTADVAPPLRRRERRRAATRGPENQSRPPAEPAQ